jgi:hypothetical protein
MEVCGQYGTHKTERCLGTLIFIAVVAKLFRNLELAYRSLIYPGVGQTL